MPIPSQEIDIFSPTLLFLLALSCTTDPDGLSIDGAVLALVREHDLELTAARARTASKIAIKDGYVHNGVKKIPKGRSSPAGHYALTPKGRDQLRQMLDVVHTLGTRTVLLCRRDSP